jgi:hypothetical protein
LLAYAGFALADPGLIRFVLRRRGPVFAAYFFAVHLLVQWAVISGGLVGAVRHLRGAGPLAAGADPRGGGAGLTPVGADSVAKNVGPRAGDAGSRAEGVGSLAVGAGSPGEGVGPLAESGR